MKDKKTLIIIIVLLVISLFFGVIGTVKHFSINNTTIDESDNPNKEFILNNKVYFYVDEKLQATYDCKTCSGADTVIDDDTFHTNYYKDGSSNLTGVINNYFSIFKKDNSYILFNIVSNSIIDEYNQIKNYNTVANQDFLITSKKSGWGIIFFELGKVSIPNDYEYIALPSHLINKKLDATKFIVKQNNMWYILKDDGTSINNAIREEIVDFNDKYYITYQDGYHIYDYENVEYLSNIPKSNIFGVGDYLFILNDKQIYIYKDANANMIKFITIPDYESIYFSIEDGGIDVIIDGKVTETLELS